MCGGSATGPHRQVCRFANALKDLGVGKGDLVALYMPMVPEAAITMLACARLGAPHSIVFGGFRKDKAAPLKPTVDSALADDACPSVQDVVVVHRTETPITIIPGWDHWWHGLMEGASEDCPAEAVDSEDRLFILYTSGFTGKPKGAVYTANYNLCFTNVRPKTRSDKIMRRILWSLASRQTITGDISTLEDATVLEWLWGAS